MKTSNLPKDHPKLIFTTPSHQFPTGVVLPVKRRIELIEYARLHDSYIVCNSIKNIKYIDDIHSSVFKQLAMAKYIEEGLLDLHIKKMKAIYYRKRTKLISALNEVFKDKVEIVKSEEGLHLLAFFQGVTFNDELFNKIKVNNIEITSGKEYIISPYSDKDYGNSLVFGYGNTDINEIENGIKILYRIMYD